MAGNLSQTADVVIVGGGVIGCSIAFRLAQAHVKVIILERGEPGAEASQAAAGMLAPQGEMVEAGPFFELCATSRDLYPAFLADLEGSASQRIGYHRDGSLLVAVGDEECKKLEKIYRTQAQLGLMVERLSGELVLDRMPALSTQVGCGLFIPGDHWVDNEQLIRGLVTACQRLGVKVQAGQAATKFNLRNGRLESIEAGQNRERYSAGNYVLAAGAWSRELTAPLGIELPTRPCRGQMIEFESPDLPHVVRSGHHYLVPRPPGRVLVGTTAEYRGFEKAVTGEGLQSILEGVSRFAPLVRSLRFRRAWAGLRPDTADHSPILGYSELGNLVFATGHFRNGILLAPVTAQLISELILTGSASRPLEAYALQRFRRTRLTT